MGGAHPSVPCLGPCSAWWFPEHLVPETFPTPLGEGTPPRVLEGPGPGVKERPAGGRTPAGMGQQEMSLGEVPRRPTSKPAP